jgi:hypothetical protein
MGMWVDSQDAKLAALALGIDPKVAQLEWRDMARAFRFLDYCYVNCTGRRRARAMEDLRRSAELKIGRPISRIALEMAVWQLKLKRDKFDRVKFPSLIGLDEKDLKQDLTEVERMIAEQQ